MAHCVGRYARFRTAVLFGASFLLTSCAGKSSSQIMPGLLAHDPVCLALDWGTGSPPTFFGSTPPDTMLLLPGGEEDLRRADSAGAEGRVALARSQQDREGGGWIWWTQQDTLMISSMSPTMDDLVVIAVRPEGRVRASWRGSGMAVSNRGSVGLQRYKCTALRASGP
jgi:hypothetical protein